MHRIANILLVSVACPSVQAVPTVKIEGGRATLSSFVQASGPVTSPITQWSTHHKARIEEFDGSSGFGPSSFGFVKLFPIEFSKGMEEITGEPIIDFSGYGTTTFVKAATDQNSTFIGSARAYDGGGGDSFSDYGDWYGEAFAGLTLDFEVKDEAVRTSLFLTSGGTYEASAGVMIRNEKTGEVVTDTHFSVGTRDYSISLAPGHYSFIGFAHDVDYGGGDSEVEFNLYFEAPLVYATPETGSTVLSLALAVGALLSFRRIGLR